MKKQSQEMAENYDKMFPWSKRIQNRSEHNFFLILFKECKVKNVLDCACGTGYHIVMFSKLGIDVVGSDISGSTLKVAKKNLNREKIKAELFQSSWQELPKKITEMFDAVVCVGSSLPLLSNDKEIEKSLRGMYSTLSRSGILIIAQRNIDRMLRERPATSLTEPSPNNFLLYINKYHPDKITLNIFYINAENEDIKGSFYKRDLSLITKKKLEKILRKVGIKKYKIYGEYEFSRFFPIKSDSLIVVIEKL